MCEKKEMKPWDICKRCNTQMVAGKALRENMSGSPDFIGDDHVCTQSPDGTAQLIDCLKCPECGFSRTLLPPKEQWTDETELCGHCEHYKIGFKAKSNPSGGYCDITEWAVIAVSTCDTGHFAGGFKRKEASNA